MFSRTECVANLSRHCLGMNNDVRYINTAATQFLFATPPATCSQYYYHTPLHVTPQPTLPANCATSWVRAIQLLRCCQSRRLVKQHEPAMDATVPQIANLADCLSYSRGDTACFAPSRRGLSSFRSLPNPQAGRLHPPGLAICLVGQFRAPNLSPQSIPFATPRPFHPAQSRHSNSRPFNPLLKRQVRQRHSSNPMISPPATSYPPWTHSSPPRSVTPAMIARVAASSLQMYAPPQFTIISSPL